MKDSSFVLRASDGVDLHVHGFAPEGAVSAVLQIAHGMSEHGARYSRLAERFTAAGFAVYAADQRGHGKSARGALGRMGGPDAWARAVSDQHALNRRVRELHPGLPLVLMGHSMGSFIVQELMWRHAEDADGVILSGSNGRPSPIARLGRFVTRLEAARLGGDEPSALVQRMSFGEFNRVFRPNRTDFDWLSRDEAEVDEYVADPLCGAPCSTHSWQSMLRALPALTAPTNLARIRRDLPVLIASGDRDPVGDFGAGARRLYDSYRGAGLEDVTLRLYPGARHEILNETNRERVEADLLEFAERVRREAQGEAPKDAAQGDRS